MVMLIIVVKRLQRKPKKNEAQYSYHLLMNDQSISLLHLTLFGIAYPSLYPGHDSLCLEYAFDQFRSAVLAMFPCSLLCACSWQSMGN